MKLIIAAGGGGHFSPALSVIDELPKDTDILVIGRKHSLEGDRAISYEYQVAKSLGIPFQTITTGRLQRRFTRFTIPSLLKFPRGFFEAFGILRSFKPDVVLSFGGYIALPVTLAAFFLKIPVVIHEQTLGAGMANIIASSFAKKVCISWETSARFFPSKKVVLTGNPIRKELFMCQKTTTGKKVNVPILYITGGSIGSHQINMLVEGCLEKLLKEFQVVHQSGGSSQFGDFERLQIKKEQLEDDLKNRYTLKKFLNVSEILETLQNADVVVSRCGITTITELLYFGKVALLIPLHFSQKNEQLENALFFKKQGLGEILEKKNITSDEFYRHLTSLYAQLNNYRQGAKLAKKLIHTDAAARIVSVVKQYEKTQK